MGFFLHIILWHNHNTTSEYRGERASIHFDQYDSNHSCGTGQLTDPKDFET